MRPLRYSLNVTLDGCYDHRVGIVNEELHRHAAASIERADALILGRVTYGMMESAWRPVAEARAAAAAAGAPPPPSEWPAWTVPFAEAIHAAKKYVVSRTLAQVDWNAELVRDDLAATVQRLKREPGKGLFAGGPQLALALTDLGLIDEYEFIVHPVIAGHGPTLFSGLRERIELELIDRKEFQGGVVSLRYRPKRAA